jgi:hypothetical protein
MPGFELKPFALIAGSAFFGVRHFNALNASIPDYDGFAASVDVKYVVRATQVTARIVRDVAFSVDTASPYYVMMDGAIEVTQRFGQWDATGRVGWQSLGYRGVLSSPSGPAAGQLDQDERGRLYGFGVGYRLGETLLMGLNINYLARRSQVKTREYDGLRVGASISYGQ